jgi:flagellar basal-body rod modification protein FlgD
MGIGGATAVDQKLDYLNLLVTELRNQNPLDPMEQKDMAAQLAQFSQLELTEEMNGNLGSMNETMSTMNTSFEGAMMMVKMDYAKSMLGKDILFNDEATGVNYIGHVQKVSFSNGEPVLTTQVSTANGTEQMDLNLNQIEGIQL